MQLSFGYVRSSSQILLKDLDWEQMKISSRLIDVTDLPEQNLQALCINDTTHLENLWGLLEKEKSHYPILDAQTVAMSFDEFENMPAFQFKEWAGGVMSRWQLSHNLTSIENLPVTCAHLKDLWRKDRLSFFEELWSYLKRNLATNDLTLIFNDITQVEQKNEEGAKEVKPKLTQSILSGTKTGNFLQGGAKERELMENYLRHWNDSFEVTEWDQTKGRFVAAAMIDKSPILIMARTSSFKALQRSILVGLFRGISA